MARIDPPNDDQLTPEQKQGFAMAEAFMGFLPNSSVTMAHWPELSATFGPFAANILAGGELPTSLKNMIAAVASSAAGCRYCMAHTTHQAHRAGGEAEKIAKVWEYQTSDLFTDAERAALDLAFAGGQVPNAATQAHFDELKKHYSNKQIVEIVSVISLFGFLNRYNDTIGSELEEEPLNFAKETFASRDWDG
ncbi:carboxymuconolactone decarboxylase family protein [uncultured Erythrobacter sp.]|uniref:carboxymuconolactone decarboxylase family protein n=1 Tax=uncultured Erythrobacter sp. TaxID=263913 RepID=UPI0026038068|nr:carboxymuconolactone decarboxylase family protein [uncultured Erythrobacter sp.]